MSRSLSIALLFLCACAGCKTEPRPSPTPVEKTPPLTETKKSPPKKAEKKKADPCAEIIAAYARELDSAGLDCKEDSDCGCYPGGVGRRAGCGGVANQKTVTRLSALWQRYRDRGCRYTQHCGGRACIPRCHEGQCVRASVGWRTGRGADRMALAF